MTGVLDKLRNSNGFIKAIVGTLVWIIVLVILQTLTPSGSNAVNSAYNMSGVWLLSVIVALPVNYFLLSKREEDVEGRK